MTREEIDVWLKEADESIAECKAMLGDDHKKCPACAFDGRAAEIIRALLKGEIAKT